MRSTWLLVGDVGLHHEGAAAGGLDLQAGVLGAARVVEVVHHDVAPSRANAMAVAWPMPESDPVMRAMRSCSRPVMVSPSEVMPLPR
jgi:hypothetical protein